MHRYNHHNQTKGVMGSVLLAGLVALGVSLFYRKKNHGNSQKLKHWTLDIWSDVIEKLKNTKEVTQENYNRIVDEASRNYAGIKNIDRNELSDFITDVKERWFSMREQFKEGKEKYENNLNI